MKIFEKTFPRKFFTFQNAKLLFLANLGRSLKTPDLGPNLKLGPNNIFGASHFQMGPDFPNLAPFGTNLATLFLPWLLRAEICQLPHNDVNEDVDVVCVEELSARVVNEHVHQHLVHGVGGARDRAWCGEVRLVGRVVVRTSC